MKSILVSLLFALISSIAFAQTAEVPTEAQIAAKKAECDAKFAGTSTSMTLARSQCHLAVSITVLEFKSRADGAGAREIKKELAQQRTLLDSITKTLKALEAASKQTPKPEVAATPQQQPQPQAGMMPPQQMGVPFQVMEAPYAAATWDMFGGSPFRAEIYSINQGAINLFGRSGMQRVVVYRNGQPIAVAHKGAPVRFLEFYTDLNGDKKPDSIPAKGFDPMFLDTIFVGYEPGDTIELVYLIPVSTVLVSGLPPQTVWGSPRRLRFKSNSIGRDSLGRADINARNGDPVY
jgi:hypothetical protein